MLVSLVIPVCNQGDEARQTVASAEAAFDGLRHEIVLVDDHSLDGSCHGMPRDVLVVRTERREGVSTARLQGYRQSRGDVLIWSDPHCRFPQGSLAHLAQRAVETQGLVEPTIVPTPGARRRFGGRLVLSDRGLRVARALETAAEHPALLGTVYAVTRDTYERLGGWPKLPGIWGYSEQALSLMAWFTSTPIVVDPAFCCVHREYRQGEPFPFSVSSFDPAANAHFVHAAFFPKTYESFWQPRLIQHFGVKTEHLIPLQGTDYLRLRSLISHRAVRSEEEFFLRVLGMRPPTVAPPRFLLNYLEQQQRRSRTQEYRTMRKRVNAALDWFVDQLPQRSIAGLSVLDVGTRDGYATVAMQKLGARLSQGIELIAETAAFAAEQGRLVRQGDMRNLADADDSWDVVSCIHALEHCPAPAEGLCEMLRILRPGGWLFLVVPLDRGDRPDPLHNWSFPSVESLLELCCQQNQIDPTTIATNVKELPRGRFEIRLAVRRLLLSETCAES